MPQRKHFITFFSTLVIISALLTVGCSLQTTPIAQKEATEQLEKGWPRERISINSDWRFTRDDPADTGDQLKYATIKNWMMASGEDLVKDPNAPKHDRPAGSLGDSVSYTKPDFNDSQWRRLSLPHDFGVEGPFKQEYDGATGRLPFWGVAWYRKHLDIPASDAGKQILLDIDGAMSYPNVWLNGQYVGGWGYGYASFRLDLTPYVKPGGENVLAIRLDNPPTSSRWYPGGGIYRNVWLTKTAPVHVAQWGTYLTTPDVTPTMATVALRVAVDNQSKSDADVTIKSEVYAIDANDVKQIVLDPSDNKTIVPVAKAEAVKIRVPAGRREETSTRTSIRNPKIWSIKDPNRYVAVTTVEQDGKVVDSYETPFGVRTIRFDPERGFVLNGESVKFQGVCDHHDLGALGAAINYRALQRQLEILREMGCNAIRTSHNPPAPELLDLCDKMGFVVMDEAFDCWAQQKRANDYHLLFNDWSEKDMRMLVRRDRNHPSIVMWSIGNEIPEQGRGEAGAAMATRLANMVHDEDPTRPTTSALNNAQPGSPFAAALDVIGVNYQGSRYSPQRPLGNYEPFHQAYPDKFVYGSETASTISTRGVYTFPVATGRGAISQGPRGGGRGEIPPATAPVVPPGQDVVAHQMSSYDLYYPSWATSPETEFGAQDRFSFVGGEFVWTGFDYLGEPTPWGGRNDVLRSSYFGIIDLAGFKKDRFYLYQAHWRPDLPMAHILPHWNWQDRAGEVTPVHVYTSGDEGELFLNGKSLGKKKKDQYTYRLRWDDVTWTPGELKVVTYKDGKHWAEDVVKTTGPAAKLRIEPDHNRIMADGQDLSFVTVTVADRQGLMVPRSMNKLKFEISGPGEIVATDNGDPTSLESFQTNEKAAFNGMCLVIVRAKAGQTGKITLKATSEGLQSQDVAISAVNAR